MVPERTTSRLRPAGPPVATSTFPRFVLVRVLVEDAVLVGAVVVVVVFVVVIHLLLLDADTREYLPLRRRCTHRAYGNVREVRVA